jgi:hypothetical protein
MTILVAYTDGTDTWIGSDLLVTRGTQRTIVPGPKWAIHNGWAIGSAGAARAGLIKERYKEEIFVGTEDALDILMRLAKAYRECGMVPTTTDGAEDWRSGGILARRGQVWEFDSALTPTCSSPGVLVADGMAWEIARGAAWAIREFRPQIEPEHLVWHVIRAACTLDATHCEGLWQGKL